MLVPQFRQIREPGGAYRVDGQGVQKLLAHWQHPGIGKDVDRARFDEIQRFLRSLLHMPNVELEVVDQNHQIIVNHDGLRLPLESYGTGIHQLIILSIAFLSQEGVLFCVEEPEIHLHASLQKAFLNFLESHPKNRFVISSHSNAFLTPSEKTGIIHVWLDGQVTKGRTVETDLQHLNVLTDLGIAASDLLQANSVVWVEGPSDRIYINKWLSLVCPELQEGVDYSIMFYGGRLLSHLSLERDSLPSPEDLIPLLRINQRSAIVIDSDREKMRARLNTTKRRIREECEKHELLCWITDGREIENYLSDQCIREAYGKKTGKKAEVTLGRYDKLEGALSTAYGKHWKQSWSYAERKPAVAREIVKCVTRDDMTPELMKRVKKLAALVTSECGHDCE